MFSTDTKLVPGSKIHFKCPKPGCDFDHFAVVMATDGDSLDIWVKSTPGVEKFLGMPFGIFKGVKVVDGRIDIDFLFQLEIVSVDEDLDTQMLLFFERLKEATEYVDSLPAISHETSEQFYLGSKDVMELVDAYKKTNRFSAYQVARLYLHLKGVEISDEVLMPLLDLACFDTNEPEIGGFLSFLLGGSRI
jgi:hypothetical protein